MKSEFEISQKDQRRERFNRKKASKRKTSCSQKRKNQELKDIFFCSNCYEPLLEGEICLCQNK